MKHKMYVPVAFMAVFFFFNILTSFGQRQYRLTGRVTDSINNNFPIAGATLTIRSTGKSAITDSKGSFSFVITDADLEYQLILSLPNGTDIPYRLQKKDSWSATYKIYRIDFFLKEMEKPKPDTDGDSVPDDIDKCPTVPGISRYNGCPVPDTDKDGINDEYDKCPTVAGTKDNNGCPATHTGIFKANWNLKTAKTFRVANVDGQEKQQTLSEVLKKGVATTHIAPTKDAERLILDLNPGLKAGQKMKNDEVIILPNFPATGAKREAELQAEFEKDLTPDENGINDFFKAAQLQNYLYFSNPFPKKYEKQKIELDYAFDLVQQATKGFHKKFKKYQTDLLNSEIEQFNMNYLKMISTEDIRKEDLVYIHNYSRTIIKLLEPIVEPGRKFYPEKKYLPQEKEKAKTAPGKSGGPSVSFLDEEEQFDEEGDELLRINIYVFTADKRAHNDSFFIYWMTPDMYNRFKEENTSLDHFERRNKIPSMASVTAKLIDPGLEYCFLAVPKSGVKRVVAFTQVKGDAILEYSGKPDMTELYAVPLYVYPQQ